MTTYAQDVAEHEFMERMIPTILAQLRQQQWQEPYAHPDYINHCEKMRNIRVRIVEADTTWASAKPQPYDCAAQETKKAYY